MTHPIDLAKIIATAWAAERDAHYIEETGAAAVLWVDGQRRSEPPVFKGNYRGCERHLDQLCATAVQTAIREAGIACVPVEPDRFMAVSGGLVCGTAAVAGEAYRAMLAAAPPLVLPHQPPDQDTSSDQRPRLGKTGDESQVREAE